MNIRGPLSLKSMEAHIKTWDFQITYVVLKDITLDLR